MESFFQNVLTASFHGSIVILAVLLLRLVLRKAPKKFICWLWTLAGLRLLMPIPLQSPFSLQPQSFTIPISLNVSIAMAVLWGVIALVIAAYSIASYIHLRRQVDDAVKVPGGWESDKIETAFVLGFLKPKIYIPTGMPKEARKQILAHERTHLDKGDHWIKMIGFVALALHWFNPLVWVSYILLCKDIEMACDERVVQFMELEERKAYSSALLRCSTNRAHYAACPVAFGEVSVKYRIKSVLNYRKPSFWLSLLCLIAIAFVAVCLMTSPETVVEVPVDPEASLQEISREDPANFTPAVLPPVEENPDWGLGVIVDAVSPTGGKIVYVVEERFAAASEYMDMTNGTLERWNGSFWEPVPSLSGQTVVFEHYGIGFARHRDRAVNAHENDVDWTLNYGALPAGDYCLVQTIESALGTEIFRTPFHIYREQLPASEEAALARCATALDTLMSNAYSVTFSETDMVGGVSRVMGLTKNSRGYRVDHYLGDICTSSAVSEEIPWPCADWDVPFRLNQNRRFLFPEGQSCTEQEEISFRSVWADFKGTAYLGEDTFRFHENGNLKSVDRVVKTLDDKGNVVDEFCHRLESQLRAPGDYVESVDSYEIEDGFEAGKNSPWGILFRVDDDYLNPSGGEIWLGVDTIGVSNYTADGKYWLEKKESGPYSSKDWRRLGGEDTEASWGGGTISLTSRTQMFNIDWTDTYGQLAPGVYRMGKRFYSGEESTIQYAQFAIYPTGGTFGEGAEEALARVNAAMDKLQSGNYRVEKYAPGYSDYGGEPVLDEVIWKYGDTLVYDFYSHAGSYFASYVERPDSDFRMDWWERFFDDSVYSSTYFAEGFSVISDREITFAQSYTQTAMDNPCTFFTYRFDEEGNLTEFLYGGGDLWEGRFTRYVVTETPDAEIQSWVESKQAEG